jgi:uncharacterized protein (TIGR02594 family)
VSSEPASQAKPITPYLVAQRYLGLGELAGGLDHPLIQFWLSLCGFGLRAHDEVPWCGAFVRGVTFLFAIAPPPFPARARYWLQAGVPVELADAQIGWDIVVLERGNPAPASVMLAPGHVGFFGGFDPSGNVRLLGGNQGNHVSAKTFPREQILGVRRLS